MMFIISIVIMRNSDPNFGYATTLLISAILSFALPFIFVPVWENNIRQRALMEAQKIEADNSDTEIPKT
jgi:hypothetical protein